MRRRRRRGLGEAEGEYGENTWTQGQCPEYWKLDGRDKNICGQMKTLMAKYQREGRAGCAGFIKEYAAEVDECKWALTGEQKRQKCAEFERQIENHRGTDDAYRIKDYRKRMAAIGCRVASAKPKKKPARKPRKAARRRPAPRRRTTKRRSRRR